MRQLGASTLVIVPSKKCRPTICSSREGGRLEPAPTVIRRAISAWLGGGTTSVGGR
jgi:hypothetical protein